MAQIGFGYSMGRDFPRPNKGPNTDPFPIQRCAKTFQNGVFHCQFMRSTI